MRILFVAFGSSVHTTRWISQLNDKGWDIHLFPVDKYYLHPDLRNITVHTLFPYSGSHIDSSVKQRSLRWPFSRGKVRLRNLSKNLPGDPLGDTARLVKVIRSIKPDIVHSLEMQHGGYLTHSAWIDIGESRFPPWIYSSWGSDIYYFGRQKEHQELIRSTLKSCNYLIADCQRDIVLAQEWGFSGEVLGVLPGTGGYDLSYLRQFQSDLAPSQRRAIVIKGRHGDFGAKALVALKALELCAGELGDYEINILLANGIVPQVAEYIMYFTNLNIKILPHNSSHQESLSIMGRSRIAINIAISEGTSNFLLEAMTMGALPIHSDTISSGEWIRDGYNGLIVPPENVEAVASAIKRSLLDDRLVDRAAEINSDIVDNAIDITKIRPQVIELYRKVLRAKKTTI